MYGWRHEYWLWKTYLRDCARWLLEYRHCALRDEVFSFEGREHRYYIHPYNHTWMNERAVELPIFMDLLARARQRGERVFEVGNVLSHYMRSRHPVLDKYEHGLGKRVIREDIASYRSDQRYDLIVSISTIEHVGWDETPRDPEKVLQVVPTIKRLLSPCGSAWISFPAGHNRVLDACVGRGEFGVSRTVCMKRISQHNQWEQVDLKTALECRYNAPFNNGNAIVFLVIEP